MLSVPSRALILKSRWLDLILSGAKTWELRGSRTSLRGKVALAASGTGLLFGVAEIIDCIGPIRAEELAGKEQQHRVPDEELANIAYRNTYAWVFSGPQRFKEPVPYSHSRGAVIWVRLDATKLEVTPQAG